MLNLVEDAAFQCLTRPHMLLMAPAPPQLTGFSSRVNIFEDVLPERVNYTTQGLWKTSDYLCGGMPVKCVASTIPLILLLRLFPALFHRFVGNLELDKFDRPECSVTAAFIASPSCPKRKPRVLAMLYLRLSHCLYLPRRMDVPCILTGVTMDGCDKPGIDLQQTARCLALLGCYGLSGMCPMTT